MLYRGYRFKERNLIDELDKFCNSCIFSFHFFYPNPRFFSRNEWLNVMLTAIVIAQAASLELGKRILVLWKLYACGSAVTSRQSIFFDYCSEPVSIKASAGEGGEGGIRTLGTSLSSYNGLANRPFRPLRHLSV